jgi:murein DD-endopeptidase MepM/ murein hydrolase activator NlpD
MRVSTAIFYTIAALLAKDLTTQAAATPIPLDTTTTADATAPDQETVSVSTLTESIAPAESSSVAPVWLNDVSTIQAETVVSVAPVPEVMIPEALAPAAPAAAESAPVLVPTPTPTPSVSTPEMIPSAERPSPATAAQSALFEQTINETELLTKFRQSSSTQPIQALTPAEIKAFQQAEASQAKNPAIAATVAEADTPNAAVPLVSPTLAETAEASLGEQAAAVANTQCQEQPSAQPTCATPAIAPPANAAVAPADDSFSLSVQPVPSGSNARNYYNLSVRPSPMLSNGNVSLMFPLSIPAAITSAFGWRVHPVMGHVRFHSGTDIGAPQGTPVLAAFDGNVEIADMLDGYGLTVVLAHSKSTEQTLYAHLSEIFVQPGNVVKQGEVIGRVGSTGLSTGPHLHFEFRKKTQEGWTVVDAGPGLEYALAQFGQPRQPLQAQAKPGLPSLFQYSGKFLKDLQAIAQAPKQPER